MTFMDHLEELRTRIIRIVVILVISFVICYSLATHIQEFLLVPLREAMGGHGKVVFTGLMDKIVAELQISFWTSVILASPFWFREVWSFIKPGLYEHEAKAVRPFLFLGFILFICGVAFGYYIVFPFTFTTIIAYGVKDVEAMMNFQDYLLMASKILVFLGLLFQLPNVMLILGFMGLVTKQSLRSWRRYMVVIFSIAAAILSPPDVISMMCVWVPMMALYELGIIAVALIVHPQLKKKHMGKDVAKS